MKFSIEQKELQKHIQIAQRAISTRNTVQILEGILFEARDNQLKLSSTDLELGILTQLPCNVSKEGRAVLSGKIINDIVRKLPKDTVFLESIDTQVKITCQNSKFDLKGYEPDEYPELHKVKGETVLNITGQEFKQAVKQTIFAVSTDDTKPVLRGVMLDIRDDGIFVVALDGFRIAVKKLSIKSDNIGSYIIPARVLIELQKILDDDQMIQIHAEKSNLSFNFGDTIVNTRLLEGQFIQYENLFKTNTNISFIVNKNQLYDALERASLLSGEERANLIKLHLSNNSMEITSNTDIGRVFEKVDGELDGEKLDIAFNARYLLEGIKEVESNEILLEFEGPLNPLLISPLEDEEGEKEEYSYLVLPVRLGQDQ